VAKVVRDRLMARLSVRYPGYGWEHNAGYATAEHRAALRALGVTPFHRRSFAPIREALAGVEQLELRFETLGPSFEAPPAADPDLEPVAALAW
jgi:ribonuclease HII